jgi:hypothetical protein
MKWLRENRILGSFLIVLGLSTIAATWFFFSAKNDWDNASGCLNLTAAELNRLERLAPYPSGENLRKMKAQADDYGTALARLKDELKPCVLPVVPMAPNEFQSRLRLAMTAVAEKARTKKVKLPDRFYLGFDEFVSALPNEVAAPLLGQELAQIEWFLDTLFDARVDALTSFRRTPLPEERASEGPPLAPPASRKPTDPAQVAPRFLERNVVEATFVSTPATARKVLNQIAGSTQQFFVIRLWHVRNEKDKGPPRELASDAAGVATGASSSSPVSASEAKPSPAAALNFIVGNERIETSTRIEIVRFIF